MIALFWNVNRLVVNMRLLRKLLSQAQIGPHWYPDNQTLVGIFS